MAKYFFFGILFLLFLSLFVPTISAEEISVTQTPVDYTLTYPGILPGHPFYFLKELRDSVVSFMIAKSLPKAEFSLIQSDKKLQTSVLLLQQDAKKQASALTMLKRAEDSFADALTQTALAQKEGIDTQEFVKKLMLSNQKHQEIIQDLEKRVKKDVKKEMHGEYRRAESFTKQIKKLEK